ncbi:Sucrose transport protein SUT2, partial [Cucurbita argyrosperma subsp. argyrosperma]
MGSVFLTLGLSLMWLCGPVFGLFVQSLVGHMSDRYTSRYGFFVIGLDSSWSQKLKVRIIEGIGWQMLIFLYLSPLGQVLLGFGLLAPLWLYAGSFACQFLDKDGMVSSYNYYPFNTDWMGRELYGGKPNEGQSYSSGVRMGAFESGCWFIWRISNIFMALCFLTILVITYEANNMGYIGHDIPPHSIVSAALINFALLGAPLAINYSVQYAMNSSRVESLQLDQGRIDAAFFK